MAMMTIDDLILLERMYLDSLDSEHYEDKGYFVDDNPYNPSLPYVRNDCKTIPVDSYYDYDED